MPMMRSVRLGQVIARTLLNPVEQCQISKNVPKSRFTTFSGRRHQSVQSVLREPFFPPHLLLSSKPGQNIDCTLRTATVHDKEEIIDFLCEYFLRREPLMKVLNATEKDTRPFVDFYVTDALRHNASFVAEDDCGRLCGIRLNAVGPVAEHGSDIDFGTKMNTLEKFLEYVEGDITKRLRTPRIMRHIAICVNPEIARGGVGTMMMQRSVDYAREHGLRYMVATCTGKIATKLASKMGFQIVKQVAYDSYVDPDSHFAQFPDDCLVNPEPHLPFLSVAEEHGCANLMVKSV